MEEMIRTERIAFMGKMINVYTNLAGRTEWNKLFRKYRTDGKKILKFFLKKHDGRIRLAQE
jgi:hypothetical protein